ncbi:MAG TPA: glutamate--tRNA ligase [bacterium]|nr:glutamate--tRNA ligase [bacterium]
MSEVRVRFAPSPTGELHVGGLRTALFNYLFARHHGGTFILRIEDTDQERYVEGAEAGIIEMLRWAGVDPDEGPHKPGACGPYRQSERLALYREAVERLLDAGLAYKCYCTPEELTEMRQQQIARGLPPKYDGRHRNTPPEEQRALEAEGRVPVVRMKLPARDERLVVNDLVRGKVAFNSSQLDDQVLLKSDGFPTYHLAVVVDDHAMGITHVLRAEEWLPSTPKHLYLYKWLGWEPPQYAHLPLLLNEDRSKMSKRKGDVAAEAYRRQGYLPEALLNFLALLGWSPGDDRELFTLPELVREFSIERIAKAGAVFDRNKLNWMNQHYIQQLAPQRLEELLRPYVAQTPYAAADPALLAKIYRAVQPALVTLADIGQHLPLFFLPDAAPVPEGVRGTLHAPEARRVLAAFRERLTARGSVDAAAFGALMKEVQKETQVKGKALWAPMRAAITLAQEGPDLGLIVDVFGKERTLARIDRALAS